MFNLIQQISDKYSLALGGKADKHFFHPDHTILLNQTQLSSRSNTIFLIFIFSHFSQSSAIKLDNLELISDLQK